VTTDRLSVTFWGVRGSIACPGPATAGYGGNTACLEIRAGNKLLIFDAGTGLKPFGGALAKQGGALDVDWFFTHTHFDHIQGIPFFSPLYDRRNRFRLRAGHLIPEMNLKQVLSEMMSAPLFPIPIGIFAAQLEFADFRAGETHDLGGGVVVKTAPLNHPNRATGYRVEVAGKSICYVTDTEHVPGRPDTNVLKLIEGADIVVYDCTYTDEEYPAHVGWGHSTWQEGIRLVERAGAKRLAIYHHDPDHDDTFMDKIAAEAEKMRPGTFVAREGTTIEV
jgi:phosphoribosyl 1,2-cyclic phosphodiesterase